MPAFKVTGTTGQAPTTSFFGLVPDKLTMLVPGHNINNDNLVIDAVTPVNFVNQGTIYNTNMDGGANAVTVTLGANTTAPDGTTNVAQKMVETNTNSIHAIMGGFRDGSVRPYTIRLAAFAKAAERTRFAMEICVCHGGGVGAGNGSTTVFDLGGGQIGVANTLNAGTPASWVAGPTGIIPYGNGWYLCYMDVTLGSANINNDTTCFFYLDSGTGTGAKSISYAGNGTSGIYIWKSSLLPPGAWALNTQTFFDDFTSISTVDVTDSRAPGFNWYVHAVWPNAAGFQGPPNDSATPATPANGCTMSIAGGTILNVASPPSESLFLQTAATDGANGFVSSAHFPGGWNIPALFETSAAWQSHTTSATHTSWWTRDLAFFANGFFVNGVRKIVIDNNFAEYGVLGAGIPADHPLADVELGAVTSSSVGIVAWNAITSYNATGVVSYLGTDYQALTSSNVNHIPTATLGVNWAVYDPTAIGFASAAAAGAIDFNQQNLYQMLWLPYTVAEPGHIINFCNGAYCNATSTQAASQGHTTYGPNVQIISGGFPLPIGISAYQNGDGNVFPMQYVGSPNGATPFYAIDFARVTQ